MLARNERCGDPIIYPEVLLGVALLIVPPLELASLSLLDFSRPLLGRLDLSSLLSSDTNHPHSTVGATDKCSPAFSLVTARYLLVLLFLRIRTGRCFESKLFLSFFRRWMIVQILLEISVQ